MYLRIKENINLDELINYGYKKVYYNSKTGLEEKEKTNNCSVFYEKKVDEAIIEINAKTRAITYDNTIYAELFYGGNELLLEMLKLKDLNLIEYDYKE